MSLKRLCLQRLVLANTKKSRGNSVCQYFCLPYDPAHWRTACVEDVVKTLLKTEKNCFLQRSIYIDKLNDQYTFEANYVNKDILGIGIRVLLWHGFLNMLDWVNLMYESESCASCVNIATGEMSQLENHLQQCSCLWHSTFYNFDARLDIKDLYEYTAMNFVLLLCWAKNLPGQYTWEVVGQLQLQLPGQSH